MHIYYFFDKNEDYVNDSSPGLQSAGVLNHFCMDLEPSNRTTVCKGLQGKYKF